MYESYDYTNSQTNAGTQIATPQQIKVQKKAEKKMARRKTWKKVGLAALLGLTFGIMAAGAFQCVTRVADLLLPETKSKNVKVIEGQDVNPEAEKEKTVVPKAPVKEEAQPIAKDARTNDAAGYTVSEIAENSMPFVVSITNKSVQQVRSMFGMGIQEYENTSVGSGIILDQNDSELLIVTNNHVIEGASSLTVGFVDDEVYEAFVKGTDSSRDLAVIAVDVSNLSDSTLNSLRVAPLGNSDDLKVGEQVVAIGNALGYGQSVTTGIVSALDREVTIDNITNNLIQTDTAINPGNSGGALINMKGELIGINSAKFASAAVEGMGYAIPIDTVKPIVNDLMNRQTRTLLEEADAGYLGITGVNVDASVSAAYSIPEGVYLQEISEGSPAEKAGLIKGDVIYKFDKSSVNSIAELKNELLYYHPGEVVEIEFYRLDNGAYVEKKIEVELGNRKGTALDPNKRVEDKEKHYNSNDVEGPESDEGEDNGNGNYFYFGPDMDIFDLFRQ